MAKNDKQVAVKKNQQVAVAMTEEQMNELRMNAPADEGVSELRIPRFGMLSKDLTEESGSGRNKTIKVIEAAGTFFTEEETDEVDEDGKKVWNKSFFKESEVDAMIFFTRRQLRFYDEGAESWISSPIYDEADEIVPIFQGKSEIARDTPENLQAMYPALTAKGKPTSKLKETKILYILIDGKPYQMNLSESSKYEFKNYQKKNLVNMVVTTMGSIEEKQGSNQYCKTSFKAKRPLNGEEANLVIAAVKDMKAYIEARKAQFSRYAEAKTADEIKADDDFENFGK